MQMALADERKVTEKLSRNLELEKRRSESLEQKVKGTHRRSMGSSGAGGASAGSSSVGVCIPHTLETSKPTPGIPRISFGISLSFLVKSRDF